MPHNCSALCDTTMHSNCNGKASFYNSNSASCKCKLTAKRDHESLEKRSSYVYLKDGRCQGRPWTKRKKYLLTFSVLLIAVCIALVIITFILVRKGYDFNLNKCDTFGSCLQKCTTVIGSNKCECQKGYILINDTHCLAEAAQLLDSVDSEINPCDDFFQYACGAWNRKHLIPEDASSYNTFEKLHDKLQIILRGLLEEPISNEDSSSTIKAKVLYKSCMNTSQIESVGDKPLQEVLKSLGGWPVVKKNWNPLDFNLERLLGRILGELNTPILIKSWVAADDKNSSANIIQLDQSRLGMPSKEYYLNDRGSEYIETYRQYMIGVAKLLGAEDQKAKQELENVLQFEIKLANISKPQNERHDTGALYAKFTLKHLQKLAPSFDWLVYFNTFIPILITENEEITTIASEYLVDMIKLVKNTSSRTIANYIFWRLALRVIPDMTSKYRRLTYNYNKVLEGITKEKVRWEKCVETINKKLGMALGAMFVKEHFKKENKETALEMIHNIREAFNELLEENDWMDNETKVVAKEKANAMNERIGYPEFIIDKKELDKLYETLTFNEYEYFKNMLKIAKYEAEKDMNKLRNPVYKDRWDQEPAVVNAFYIPNTNDIVLPAGILQPLFYSHHFPKSLNYGGIGVVIGHEITHGFDDKGRLYDKDGNIKQWWKNETIQEFRDRAQCMIDQYSGYKLEQIGSYINGKNTLGENIADNGGLKQAYRAYHRWVKKHGEESLIPGIGLTHDQLFFLNYAQIWCGKMRNEEALQKIRTSFHSPGPIRVLGPLSNSKDFAKAYHCPLGSRMNPVHKCSLW